MMNNFEGGGVGDGGGHECDGVSEIFDLKIDFEGDWKAAVLAKPPLGLKLTITPSLIESIKWNLSHKGDEIEHARGFANGGNGCSEKKKITGTANRHFNGAQPLSEKLKASNFNAMKLTIGNWERISQSGGDVVAKFYYSKKRILWELLDEGLKSKIEIQWSDILSMKASYKEDELAILEVELGQAPLFFQETNPLPRKHTTWQGTTDFTGGQATVYRRHYIEFPKGVLERHYEKLLNFDSKLMIISQRPFPTLSSAFFDPFHGDKGHSHTFKSQGAKLSASYNQPLGDCSSLQPVQVVGDADAIPTTEDFNDFGSLIPYEITPFGSPNSVNSYPSSAWEYQDNCIVDSIPSSDFNFQPQMMPDNSVQEIDPNPISLEGEFGEYCKLSPKDMEYLQNQLFDDQHLSFDDEATVLAKVKSIESLISLPNVSD